VLQQILIGKYLHTYKCFAGIEQNTNTKIHSVCSMVTHKTSQLSSIISFKLKRQYTLSAVEFQRDYHLSDCVVC